MPSFNVLTEPWIPIIRMDGARDEVGILFCLQNAQAIREIRDPSPIVEFGLYRLLVAFVLDALIRAGERPSYHLHIKNLIKKEAFPVSLWEGYIESCGDVFDLFHPTRPFLQTQMPQGKTKPLAGALPVVPSGTNALHWHHAPEEGLAMSPPAAARLLTVFAPFMTAGGAGLSPSINGAPPIYALPVGFNLYETLCLNLPWKRDETGDGKVAWRELRVPGSERVEATHPEALTWRPRKVQLVPDPQSGMVSAMKFEKGDSTRLGWSDPNLGYKEENDKSTPIRMREGRPVWRDAGHLFLFPKGASGSGQSRAAYRRPDVVETAFKIQDGSKPIRIVVYGMRTDMKMKVFEWVRSEIEIPVSLGRQTQLGAKVVKQQELAERAAFYLSSSIKSLYPREGAGNRSALGSLAARAERQYWLALEREFGPMMQEMSRLDPDLPDGAPEDARAGERWRTSIVTAAQREFENAAKDMDADAKALERLVKSRARLSSSLRKHIL